MSALPATRPQRTAGRPAPTSRGRPKLRVVAAPRHTSRWVFIILVGVAVGIFGIVSLAALAAEQAFATRALQQEINELTHRYEELSAEVARLESPARVRHVAEQELGMVPAEHPAYLVVEHGWSAAPVSHLAPDDGEPGQPVADPLKEAMGASQ